MLDSIWAFCSSAVCGGRDFVDSGKLYLKIHLQICKEMCDWGLR